MQVFEKKLKRQFLLIVKATFSIFLIMNLYQFQSKYVLGKNDIVEAQIDKTFKNPEVNL